MTAGRLEASVIVALNPHASDPAEVFDAYVRQTMPLTAFEVIVADDGSRPDVPHAHAEHLRACPATPVRRIASGRTGRAAANNAGVRAARADLLVFVADDFIPSPTLVRAHVEFHRHLQAPAVGVGPGLFPAALREDPFCRWLEDSGRLFGLPFRTASQSWPRDFFYVGNVSLGRALFDRVGEFDERYLHDQFDDFDFAIRLRATGACSHYLPKALAWHDHRVPMEERLQAMRRTGRAARVFERSHPGIRPWAALTARPLAEVAAAAARAAAANRMASTTATRGDWYRAVSDLAFAEGYHDAAAPAAPGRAV
jgi:GT2 family glycosyltransferase